MQIIAKNQNGNGLIFGIPQRAAVFQFELCECIVLFLNSFSAVHKRFAHFVAALATERMSDEMVEKGKGLFLVIFAWTNFTT